MIVVGKNPRVPTAGYRPVSMAFTLSVERRSADCLRSSVKSFEHTESIKVKCR
jgi:hypothetical protein